MNENGIVRAIKKAEAALNKAIDKYNVAADAVDRKRTVLEVLRASARKEHGVEVEGQDCEAPRPLGPVQLDLREGGRHCQSAARQLP